MRKSKKNPEKAELKVDEHANSNAGRPVTINADKQLGIRLDATIVDRLAERAALENTSVSDLVRTAIVEFLDSVKGVSV